MSITVALYSHDSVGLGHARRNRAIAYALAADLPRITGERVRGVLIAGHPDATKDSLPPGWDWMILPGVTRTREGYASRRLDMSMDKLAALRGSAVSAALDAISPDLFIVDRHAFGVAGELKGVLENLRERHRCATVLGLREVLDTPEVAREEWERLGGADVVAGAYDAVWVYGDPGVYDPVRTGEIPAALATRCISTGYLAHGRPDDPGAAGTQPYVLTVVGGGSDGRRVSLAAAHARVPAGHRQIIVTGPQMPVEDFEEIHASAGEETTVLRSARNVPALIRDAAAVICMGGYNSLAEVMATDTPALVVPRSSRRAEQPRRAAALAAAGAVDTITAEQCRPEALSAWLSGAVHRRAGRDHLDLDGLTRLGDLAAAHITARQQDRTSRLEAADAR
ncbi:glycosyltransferase family protein [Sediminivirga luteola]|uniref:glycosyltransferase family protein n=1 Tax=Sediminivirga luteola TaxID=1774748 RepID=UPI001F5980EF|nr:glycosyltransferase [Sediminivirga luteola]MCI2265994.1 glycosyl transferase [Sediminivirga luteola]